MVNQDTFDDTADTVLHSTTITADTVMRNLVERELRTKLELALAPHVARWLRYGGGQAAIDKAVSEMVKSLAAIG